VDIDIATIEKGSDYRGMVASIERSVAAPGPLAGS
jgi:hypothetical protein